MEACRPQSVSNTHYDFGEFFTGIYPGKNFGLGSGSQVRAHTMAGTASLGLHDNRNTPDGPDRSLFHTLDRTQSKVDVDVSLGTSFGPEY
jgi:hypothetical protein